MPQNQAVKRVVDALRSQERIIIHLACGHNITITKAQVESDLPGKIKAEIEHADKMLCPYCPDPPPRGENVGPQHQFRAWTEPRVPKIDLPSPKPEDFSD